MSKSTHDFAIGYEGDNQVRYGKDYNGSSMYIDPMTLFQAKIAINKLQDGNARIFQLIDVTDAVMGEDEHGK